MKNNDYFGEQKGRGGGGSTYEATEGSKQTHLRSTIEIVESDRRIIQSDLIIVKKDNSTKFTQGTWVHRLIAIDVARWVNLTFAVQMTKWLHELFTTRKVELQRPTRASSRVVALKTPFTANWNGIEARTTNRKRCFVLQVSGSLTAFLQEIENLLLDNDRIHELEIDNLSLRLQLLQDKL